ncbi:hypothetical protein CCACVL1_30869 [Corchorus capsularis]|uniref:Uncharacterized protein n=1 Tax=Corchorus capsularis TaxID=210143 RepID=A0A1R3FV04_COCAP|nr:hypothetical protein CCACVL1_30869 [Corchorus capsularis]
MTVKLSMIPDPAIKIIEYLKGGAKGSQNDPIEKRR